MFRIPLLVAVISIVLVAMSGSAAASPQFAATFQIGYTSQVPGTSSGLTGLATWSDPGEQFGKPAALKKIVFAFNPGAKFDTSALPQCKATDQQVRALGAASSLSCQYPGRARRHDRDCERRIPTYDGRQFLQRQRPIIVVVELNGKKLTFFRDDAKGSTITANLVIPQGIALTKLHVVFPAHTSKSDVAEGTPQEAGLPDDAKDLPRYRQSWTTNATFFYDNGFSHTLSATTPCVPPAVADPKGCQIGAAAVQFERTDSSGCAPRSLAATLPQCAASLQPPSP